MLPLFFPKKFVIVTLSNLYYVRFLNEADQDIFLVFTIYFLLVIFQLATPFIQGSFSPIAQPPQKTSQLCLSSALK